MKKKALVILLIALSALIFTTGCSCPLSFIKDFGYRFNNEEAPQTNEVVENDDIATHTIRFIDGNDYLWLDESHITSASTSYDTSIGYYVNIHFNESGALRFKEATANIGRTIYIYYDDILISAPTVNDVITSDSCMISGNFTYDEAHTLAEQLNSAALG